MAEDEDDKTADAPEAGTGDDPAEADSDAPAADDSGSESDGDGDALADAAADKAKASLGGGSGDAAAGSRRRRRKRPAASTAADAKASVGTGTVSADEASKTTAEDADDDAAPRMDLPKWNRARVKRKAPKGEEQDAFQEGVRKAGKGAVRLAPLVIGGVVIAAVALALGIYLTRSSAESLADETKTLAKAAAVEARGIVEETKAERTRATPRPTAPSEEELRAQATSALSNLASTAPDSAAHRLSRLVQAGRAMRAADFPGAEASYRAYLDGEGDASLNFVAREGMVLAIEAQGRFDDALTELEPLLGGDARGFFRDQALWDKGRILEAKGDAEAALATYREYVENFPLAESSFARELVVERLTELDPDFVPPPSPQPQGMPGLGNLPLSLQ